MHKINLVDIASDTKLISTEIDLAVVSLEALKKTCYKFSNEFFYNLQLSNGGESAVVEFRVPIDLGKEKFEDILQKFYREALDQELREVVFSKTETVRNLILANAFANTDLVE
ncbi:His-Xaa-Ser system protein HxsD [Cobetia crustatorum]|uniref:His-Xaa-Ser system protein HxsD n=1 Tax=Cobetia crustatorum TaxID=553385 RepID=UPI00046A9CF4|nr:His-Xaa-Ser system protein HxsD [Cobetia crustatorum]